MSAPLLAARGLTIGHRLGRRRRVVSEGLDLELNSGELVCLLGRNGSGKSTLLRTFAGLLEPLAGRIEVAGAGLETLHSRARARRLAVVLPQTRPLGPVTAWELAALGRYAHTSWTGRLRTADRAAIQEALEATGAADLSQRRVTTLSDGERQKVAIARALAQEAKIVLLDEPTAFLDITARAELTATLASLASHGRALLLSTHDLELALHHADRLWIISGDGVDCGSPAALSASGALERAFGAAAAHRVVAAGRPGG